MKLWDAQLCISCDELVGVTEKICPCCTDSVLIPLSEWLAPISTADEIKIVHQMEVER